MAQVHFPQGSVAENRPLISLVLLLRQVVVPVVVVVVVTLPLPRNRGMAEHHRAPEAGQLPRAWARGRRERENRQRASGKKSPYLDSAE